MQIFGDVFKREGSLELGAGPHVSKLLKLKICPFPRESYLTP